MTSKAKTFRFLGKTYPLDGNCSYYDGGKAPIYIKRGVNAGYRAYTRAPLEGLFWSDAEFGATPQKAASALERAMLREFKRQAKALGYEVTG